MSLLFSMNSVPGKKESWADMIERIQPGFFNTNTKNLEMAKQIEESIKEAEERKRKLEEEYEENFNKIKSKVGADTKLTAKLLDNLMNNTAAYSEAEIHAMAEKKEELLAAYAEFTEDVEGKTYAESLEIIDEMNKLIDSAKKMLKKMGGKTDMAASRTGVSRKGNKSRANVFSKIRATFKAAAANKGKLESVMKSARNQHEERVRLAHEEGLKKKAEKVEESKKIDFVKAAYDKFAEDFSAQPGYTEFTQQKQYVALGRKSTSNKGDIRSVEEGYDYLVKQFKGFIEKVYSKKAKKGGRRTQRKRRTGRKTARKTGRKAGRKQ